MLACLFYFMCHLDLSLAEFILSCKPWISQIFTSYFSYEYYWVKKWRTTHLKQDITWHVSGCVCADKNQVFSAKPQCFPNLHLNRVSLLSNAIVEDEWSNTSLPEKHITLPDKSKRSRTQSRHSKIVWFAFPVKNLLCPAKCLTFAACSEQSAHAHVKKRKENALSFTRRIGFTYSHGHGPTNGLQYRFIHSGLLHTVHKIFTF